MQITPPLALAALLAASSTAAAAPSTFDRRQSLGSLLGGLVGKLFSGTVDQPEVTLEYGTYKGVRNAPTNTNNFLGIPYAKAGRLANPTLLTAADNKTGVQDASKYGSSCPQTELVASPGYSQNAVVGQLLGFLESIIAQPVLNQAEDCLSINVQVPANVKNDTKLPVIAWIHGGGFEVSNRFFLNQTLYLIS
jgi:carboxylesterase type B